MDCPRLNLPGNVKSRFESRLLQREFISSFLLLLFFCYGCSEQCDTPWYRDADALNACYLAAVQDAEEVLPEEICRTLPAIVSPDRPDDPRQQWKTFPDGKALVLVGSMMSAADAAEYPDPSEDNLFEMDDRLPWVTLPYDLSDHLLRRLPVCNDSLECRMRLIQLLGLPPSCDYDRITFFYAEAERLFRPSPDNETTDHEAGLDFPATASQAYRDWFEDNRQFSYYSDTPYPWTRLGYTYDWHCETDSHVGPGEFIVSPGAAVQVVRKVGVWTWYLTQTSSAYVPAND